MPGNIAQYNSAIDTLKPSDEGDKALARAGSLEDMYAKQAGSEVGGAVKSIGQDVSQHETLTELSEGGAALATLTNNLHTQWQQMAAKADPNDKTIQGTFLNENLEPQLDKFQSAFDTEAGQKWGVERANDLRQHLYTTTSADMMIRSGNAVKQNLSIQATQLADLAEKNPGSMDQSLSQIDAMIEGIKQNNPGLKGADDIAYDMKNNVVKSGLKGLADQNPAAAIKASMDANVNGYLSATDQKNIISYAKVQAQAKSVEQQQKEAFVAQQQKTANEKVVGDVSSQIASGKAPVATAVVADKSLSPEQKTMFVGQGGILSQPPEQLQNPKFGGSFNQALPSIYSGKPISADDLVSAMHQQQITPAGAAQLKKLSDMTKTPEGVAELNAQKSVLMDVRNQLVKGGTYASDPAGLQQYNNFMNTFYSSWDAAIKKGATPAELSDPNSKDYIGNLATQFKRTDAQTIADVTKVSKTPVAPPKPSDADVAYLRANPAMASKFDGRFGKGASSSVLGDK